MKHPIIHPSIDRKYILYAIVLLLVFTLVPLSLFTTFIFSPATNVKPTSTRHIWILVPLLWALIALLLLGVGWATVFVMHRASSLLRERDKQTKFMMEDVLKHFKMLPSENQAQQQPLKGVHEGQQQVATLNQPEEGHAQEQAQHPLRFTFCHQPSVMRRDKKQPSTSMSSCPAALRARNDTSALAIQDDDEREGRQASLQPSSTTAASLS
ncbi:hypothetical protein C9374_004120 [Naegleria lovaniensis]|uniref:Uncharacterized protein n=1 Tax=Naegleria lovaniensis TaxID=51637 RepID=A0AA88KJ16_NAELO|nr:uncharacterized protein C9374_004120 [Naegleria lovaniensis]KAG2383449.1 hypothetical protein C9374_004120 [Naegleria lovaniensis]